jgi:hypothetical protein
MWLFFTGHGDMDRGDIIYTKGFAAPILQASA